MPWLSQRSEPSGLLYRQTVPQVPSLAALTLPGEPQLDPTILKTPVPRDAAPSQMRVAWAGAAPRAAANSTGTTCFVCIHTLLWAQPDAARRWRTTWNG